MSFPYCLHPKADEDFAQAYERYEDKPEGLGERFIAAVRKR